MLQSHPMGLLKRLEKGLERVIDGLSARAFRGRLSEAQLLRQVAEATARMTAPDGSQQVANTYRVGLHPDDLPLFSASLERLVDLCAAAVRRSAETRGWPRPLGLEVSVVEDAAALPGEALVDAGYVPRDPRVELVGEQSGRRVRLDQEALVIGREPSCGLCLPNDGVSRRHARIELSGGDYVVTDLNSANGTTLNGARVVSAPLRDGDRVGFGPAVFVFTVN